MPSDNPTISLCMIVKNEENFLERCLNSVKDFVDEIIIIDTGSKDRTEEIAKRFTNHVYRFEWCDDFSKARNESLKHAKKDWILVLDADETISEEDMKRIREIIRDKDIDGYKLTQRNYSDSVAGVSCKDDKYEESRGFKSYFPSMLVRLFRNKGYRFQNKIHEVIEDSMESIGANVAVSGIPIHHKADKSKDRSEFYIRLIKKQIHETPKDPKPYYELGKMRIGKKDYSSALENFRKSIKLLGSTQGLLINKLIFSDAGIACFRLNKYDDALAYFNKAIENDDHNPINYFYKALIFHELGNIKDAFEMYKASIEHRTRDPVAYANLGDICLKNKDYANALKLLEKACELEHPMKDKLIPIVEKIRDAIKDK